MSTGDQSQYVRSKLAERGATRGAKFMRDGFDMWAESEAPAREGQMPKMASEPMEENYGGAMTVHHAKKLHHKLSNKLHGGSALSDAVDAAKKIINFWRELSAWLDEFDADLQDEIIDNPGRPAAVKAFAKELRSKLAAIKGAKAILDGVAALAGTVGLGKHELHGGMSLEEAGKYVQTIIGWFKWLYNAYNNIVIIINLPSFERIRPHIMKALSFIKGAVGLGKRCGCHGGAEEMVSPGMTFEDVTPKGGRSRSKMMLMPHGTAPSDEHVSTMPYEYGGAKVSMGKVSMGKVSMGGRRKIGGAMSTMPYEGGAMSTMPYEDGAESYYSEGKPPRKKGGKSCGGAKVSMGKVSMGKVSMGGRRKIGGSVSTMPYEGGAVSTMPYGGRRKIGGRAPSARGAIVKKVMQEHGLSLPQASKYVKEHGLY